MSWVSIILGSCVMGLISSVLMEFIFRKHHARMSRRFNEELLEDLDCGHRKVQELRDQLEWTEKKSFHQSCEIIQLMRERDLKK